MIANGTYPSPFVAQIFRNAYPAYGVRQYNCRDDDFNLSTT